MKTDNMVRWFFWVPLFLLLTAIDARAYLDPGTGSYTFQLLIAGLTSAYFLIASLKRRMVKWFGGRIKRDQSSSKNS
jgi:hypothetical protein